VKAFSPAALGLCISLLISLPAPAIGAGQTTASEDVPLRGGVAALAAVASVTPAPDRARAVAELARAVYSWPQTGPYSNESVRRGLAAHFAESAPVDLTEAVPVPLSPAIWSQAIFHRPIEPQALVGAILTDRTAALMSYGLAGMDDETLRFFGDHAPLLGRLAERAPAAFAAFGESLRIREGRITPRGGEALVAPWEAVVGEKLDRPERFVPALFERDRGRLAYLYDVVSHLDAPMFEQVFGAGRSGPDPVASLKRLAALARRAFPEWDVTTAPFIRPQSELAAFFARLRNASAGGDPAGMGSPAFWQRVFGDGGEADAATAARFAAEARADSTTLAEMTLGHPARERERRLDLLTFGNRVFAGLPIDDVDIGVAIRGFGSFPVLMLTLERMGVRTPALYAAAVHQAERLTGLDASRGHVALTQFQGSLALVARLAAVRTIDTATAERLTRDLVTVKLNDDGRYEGAIAAWISGGLRSAIPANATQDEALLVAAAGVPPSGPPRRVEWEGQRYVVDPAGAELQRLRRARARQEDISFDTVLGLAALGQTLTHQSLKLDDAREAVTKITAAETEMAAGERAADTATLRTLKEAAQTLTGIKRPGDLSEARRVGAQLVQVADEMLGGSLMSLAYAFDLGDPEGTILIAGDPSRRHDFGHALAGRDARVRSMWGVAGVETRGGPWHLVGSALGLDLAMAQLALRRISVDRVPESPMLNLMQRDGFAASVAVLNPESFTDRDRDSIAGSIERGNARVQDVVAGRESVDAIVDAIGMDGWRTRALRWTTAHDPEHTASLFSTVELLVLGGEMPAAFNAWGVYSLRTAGCLCARLPAPGEWRHWWGLSQSGLPATLVADLPLRVAVVLHNLQLPAVLAKPVLAAAMQDFVDGINPTDGNDWLTLARAAQAIGRERFEDYVAAATADGPLVPDAPARPGEQ
jgi:hypothetical protein